MHKDRDVGLVTIIKKQTSSKCSGVNKVVSICIHPRMSMRNYTITIKKLPMMSTKEVIHVMVNKEESNLTSKTTKGDVHDNNLSPSCY